MEVNTTVYYSKTNIPEFLEAQRRLLLQYSWDKENY